MVSLDEYKTALSVCNLFLKQQNKIINDFASPDFENWRNLSRGNILKVLQVGGNVRRVKQGDEVTVLSKTAFKETNGEERIIVNFELKSINYKKNFQIVIKDREVKFRNGWKLEFLKSN